MPCGKFVSGTLTIGASVQRKLARLPIRWLTRKPGRSCGALPWTTTVSLSLPRSNSPIRKEERLAIKLRTDCSLESLLRLRRVGHWLQRTNLWRKRTNLRTGSERLTGVIRRLDSEALAYFGPGH